MVVATECPACRLPPFRPTAGRRLQPVPKELKILRVVLLKQASTFGEVHGDEPIGRLLLIAQFVEGLTKPQPQEWIVEIRPTAECVLYGPTAFLPLAQQEVTIGDCT